MGSKGGGTTNSVTNPWGGATDDLHRSLESSLFAFQNPAPYYPGSTFVGPTSGELSAWGNRLGYADRVFGGAQAPWYGDATSTLTRGLASGFGPAGTAGGLDARGAIQSALSGAPDYGGLDAAVAAANAPILRQFNEQILPGLNQRATFLNNPTGGYKALSSVMPDIAQRMSENATGLYNAERIRALTGRDSMAGMVAGLGQNANADSLRALQMFPTLAQFGSVPGDLSAQFADWGRGFQQSQLEDSMNRWNYYAGLPRDQAQWYLGQVQPAAGMGGGQSITAPGGSRLAGAAGGALAGGTLANSMGLLGGTAGWSNPWGWAMMVGGGLLGAM